MVFSATHGAVTTTMALAPFAGKIAHLSSATTVLSATNLTRTVEALDQLTSAMTAKSGVSCGTLSAVRTSTTWPAASARQTVPPA